VLLGNWQRVRFWSETEIKIDKKPGFIWARFYSGVFDKWIQSRVDACPHAGYLTFQITLDAPRTAMRQNARAEIEQKISRINDLCLQENLLIDILAEAAYDRFPCSHRH